MAYYGSSTARLYRDRRYWNIWLVGAGPALALSEELYDSLFPWIGVIEGQHDQMLRSMMFQSGLTHADLVAVDGSIAQPVKQSSPFALHWAERRFDISTD